MSGTARVVMAIGTCAVFAGTGDGRELAETRVGYVIPAACSTPERIGASETFARNHTTECALEESCEASGYGLWWEGSFLRFDSRGHELARAYLEGTDREDGNLVSATGDFSGSPVRVAELSPASELPARDLSGAFERLRGLVGDWKGRYANGTWEEAAEWKPVRVSYALTGRGSALLESYYYGDSGEAGMSTAYHMDGPDLRLTHYCGAGNQPRMKAVSWDPASRLRFGFLDVTNATEPGAYYSRELQIEFVDDDRVRLTYRGVEDGEVRPQVYDLTRVEKGR